MQTDTRAGSAHAKINLGLEIHRKRSDGYHELATIFCPLSLSDDLTVTRSTDGISLHVDGINIPGENRNLCVRAAELLTDAAHVRDGVRIDLVKRIPVGAGLGGGSSDAARTLLLLNELWETKLSKNELITIAVQLGADVPYFLSGGIASAMGIGDRLTSLNMTFPYWIVTVIPPVQVSTAWAYGRIRPRNTDDSPLLEHFVGAVSDLDALSDLLVNDFEPVVLPEFPEITSAMTRLRETGLSCVRMSGTGAAVFGLTDSEQIARRACDSFGSPFTVCLTPPVRS